MDRIIEVKVNGGYLSMDSRKAGNQYEANITKLRITFDPSWDGYAKTVIFRDALGQNPVKRILTADLLDQLTSSTRVYICPIPGEAMTESGMMSFTITGYVDGVRQCALKAELEVEESDHEEGGEPADPTPTQAEQLQVQIDTILGDMQEEAIRAEEAAEEAKQSENFAAMSATAAQASATAAQTSAGDAQNAVIAVQNAGEEIVRAAEGFADKAQTEAESAEAAKAGALAAQVAAEKAAKEAGEAAGGDFVTNEAFEAVFTNYLPGYVNEQLGSHDTDEEAHWEIRRDIYALQYLNKYLWKAAPYRNLVTENYVHVSGSYWVTISCAEAEIDSLVVVLVVGTGFTFDPDTGRYTLENPANYQMPYADFVANGATALQGRYVAKSASSFEVRYFTEGSTIEVNEFYEGSAPNRMFYSQFATNNVTRYRSAATGYDSYVATIDKDEYAGEAGFVFIGKLADFAIDMHTHADRHAAGGVDPVTPASIGAAEAEHTHTPEDIGAQPAATAINTGNIGSQSVDYANKAGQLTGSPYGALTWSGDHFLSAADRTNHRLHFGSDALYHYDATQGKYFKLVDSSYMDAIEKRLSALEAKG